MKARRDSLQFPQANASSRPCPWLSVQCATGTRPPEPIDLAGHRVRRKQDLSGLTHEYYVAALPQPVTGKAGQPSESYFRAPQAAGSARAISSMLHGGVTGCASPLPGWRTSTAPWRAALCPDLDAAASRGARQQGFPVSPVRDSIRPSRSCTCRGLVMDLSSTCRIPAPVTHRITRLRCPLAAAVSEVPGQLT